MLKAVRAAVARQRKQTTDRMLTKKRRAVILADKWTAISAKAADIQVSQYMARDRPVEDFQLQPFQPQDNHLLRTMAERYIDGGDAEPGVQVDADIAIRRQLVDAAAVVLGVQRQAADEDVAQQPVDGRNRVARLEILRLRRLGLSLSKIAKLTRLKPGMVASTIAAARVHGRQFALDLGTRNRGKPAKLNHGHLIYLERLVEYHEGEVTVRQLREALVDNFPQLHDCSPTTVWKALQRHLGYRKRLAMIRDRRMVRASRQRDIEQYLVRFADAIVSETELWSVDESCLWIGQRSSKRWTKRGSKRVNFNSGRSLEKLTILLGVSSRGRYFCQLLKGSTTTPVFSSYLLGLREYAGDAGIAVLLDNASFHHTSLCKASARSARIDCIYLPAYYPEGNPVEMAFAYVKNRLYKTFTTNIPDTVLATYNSLQTTTSDHIQRYFRASFNNTLSSIH